MGIIFVAKNEILSEKCNNSYSWFGYVLLGCPNNQSGVTAGNGLLQHQVSVSGTTNSHQNMSINGISVGHSSNTGITQGAPGNIINGGFGSNSSGPNYSSTSK